MKFNAIIKARGKLYGLCKSGAIGSAWSIEGDFLAHDYRIISGDEDVMTISKKWFTWGDTYDLNINEKFNLLLALASCIVIDCVCHEGNGN